MTQIRLADKNDLPAVARIMTDGWRATYAGIFPDDYLASLTYEGVREKWETFLSDPAHFIYVADVDGTVSAFIAGNCAFREAACGFIESFHSLPAVRGKGHGRLLITTALDHFRSAGKAHGMVYVIAENARARAMYAHFGAEVGEFFTDRFDGIETNSVSMRWTF